MISNFQSLNILAKNSILDVFNEPQGQYVWNWFLESLILFSTDRFIPGGCLLLNGTFLLAT